MIPVSSKKQRGWATRDILLLVAISVALGMVLVAARYAMTPFSGLGSLMAALWRGLFLLPSFFVIYVLRRPGAGFIAQMVVALMQALFAPTGFALLLTGLANGLAIEAAAALVLRYRHFSTLRMVGAGFVAGAILMVLISIFFGVLNLEPLLIIAIAGAQSGSCILGAVLAVALAQAVQRTGALHGTPFGQVGNEA
ncbi:MAG: ECF transporter S component [Chloroflexaceae bacterium]|nr:ECF transporter S component [Chloroflexaceae bacterium]